MLEKVCEVLPFLRVEQFRGFAWKVAPLQACIGEGLRGDSHPLELVRVLHTNPDFFGRPTGIPQMGDMPTGGIYR